VEEKKVSWKKFELLSGGNTQGLKRPFSDRKSRIRKIGRVGDADKPREESFHGSRTGRGCGSEEKGCGREER